MTITETRGLHDMRFPNESTDYRRARNALLESEMALRRQIEAVAAERRALPLGGAVLQDYVFEEGDDARPVRLSELFDGKPSLLVYCYMYGPAMERPCPSCTSMLDAMDGQVDHIRQRTAIAIVARSPIARILDFARERGWRRLRLLSSAHNSFHADYHGEDEAGDQRPIMNVFTREDGIVRHTWSSELAFAPREPGQDPRHIDAIWPLWNALDFTPEGRGESFRPKLSY